MPILDKGEGIYLYGVDGNRYLDGASGSALVTNPGHSLEAVHQPMAQQACKLSYGAPHAFSNRPLLELGERI